MKSAEMHAALLDEEELMFRQRQGPAAGGLVLSRRAVGVAALGYAALTGALAWTVSGGRSALVAPVRALPQEVLPTSFVCARPWGLLLAFRALQTAMQGKKGVARC